jgi:alpha-ribazole phosphatase
MIYLIRHTTPAVARGICYGQTDLDVTGSFPEEAEVIRHHLPADIGPVYSSPLKRCTLLAQQLFPDRPLRLMRELMEIHCGEWEMRAWDELPPAEVNPWMADFVRVRIPGGESYQDLHQRVTRCWEAIRADRSAADTAVIAHGGVLRSILSGINDTPLMESFSTYSLHYGCVIRLFETEGGWRHEALWNQAPAEKEQHKPSGYYRK